MIDSFQQENLYILAYRIKADIVFSPFQQKEILKIYWTLSMVY